MKRMAVVRSRYFMLLGASLAGLVAINVEANEGPGITVSETGVVEAMPDVVELTATIEGNAELAGDAVLKYRDKKRKVVDSLNGLNFKGMTVVGSGPSINSGTTVNPIAALQAGQANQPKPADRVAVNERLIVTLSGINTMSADDLVQSITRIIDVAKDAGVGMGAGPKSLVEIQLGGGKPAALATFKLSNIDSLRQQAYEAAVKQARAKADRLAKLASVELGNIVSIQETAPAAKDDSSGGGMTAYLAMFGRPSSTPSEHSSVELQKIPVKVSLSVQFDIVKKK
jgi:uncharacterized protein YggE